MSAATTDRMWSRCDQYSREPSRRRQYGYSDGKDVGGEKFVGKWATYGRNLAIGKSYTASVPSVTDYDAAPWDAKKLTDGVVGPCWLWSWGAGHLWRPDTNPTITLDLGPRVVAPPLA